MNIPEELRRHLADAPFAAVCVPFDLGRGEEAVVVVKSSRDLLEALKEAEAPLRLGWVVENRERGPVLCLVVQLASEGVGDLAAEVYFDLWDPEDEKILRCFGAQEVVRAVLLDEELSVAWLAAAPWGEVERLRVEQVRDRAEEYLENTEDYDFEAARASFQEDMPLARLLRLALLD